MDGPQPACRNRRPRISLPTAIWQAETIVAIELQAAEGARMQRVLNTHKVVSGPVQRTLNLLAQSQQQEFALGSL